MASGFNLVDDSLRKDVSKILSKKDYERSASSGNQWSFKKSVKEDLVLKQRGRNQSDATTTVDEKLLQLRDANDFSEFDKGLGKIRELVGLVDRRPVKKGEVGPAPKPKYLKEDLISFYELFISKPLVKACTALEYDHPTSIQRRVIPHILNGKDVLVNAVTGSGKTASYLLPILEKSKVQESRKAKKFRGTSLQESRVLILHPTRELAAQCASMFDQLTKFVVPKVTHSVIIGGSSTKRQEEELLAKPDVIIATPGRLIDILLNSKNIHLGNIETLVLDEADKLLEMGMKEMVEEILKQLKQTSEMDKVQTLLFSATLNKDIKDLAELTLTEPETISEDRQQNSVNAQLKLQHLTLKAD